MAALLGARSLVTVAVPVGATASLKLLKMLANGAVGVPVQSSFDAEDMMTEKALETAPERPPWM